MKSLLFLALSVIPPVDKTVDLECNGLAKFTLARTGVPSLMEPIRLLAKTSEENGSAALTLDLLTQNITYTGTAGAHNGLTTAFALSNADGKLDGILTRVSGMGDANIYLELSGVGSDSEGKGTVYSLLECKILN